MSKGASANCQLRTISRTHENTELSRELLTGRVLLKGWNVGIEFNPILLGAGPTVEHRNKAFGVVECPCL